MYKEILLMSSSYKERRQWKRSVKGCEQRTLRKDEMGMELSWGRIKQPKMKSIIEPMVAFHGLN